MREESLECTAACRTVVVASRAGMGEIDETILGADWHVRRVASMRELGCAIRDGVPKAGLVDFGSAFSAAELDLLERCMQVSHVGWVAALPPAMLNHERVRQLVRDYCVDYVQMPLRTDEAAYSLRHAWGMASLAQEVTPAPKANHARMLGECPAMHGLFRAIRKVAQNSAPAFIAGESGTGKELTAQAIHEASSRAGGPFIAINCGAIPPHLIQSELFGYEKGAFTGAHQRHIGWVEHANGGTLFLDEIGDLPLESQVSLLRFLQQGTITRLGGHQAIPLDIRIISATHVDLEAAQHHGGFRTDLFHRLCVLTLSVPPLRERGSDIVLLAQHILAQHASEASHRIRGFTPCALHAMMHYPWPGNVRELINRVRRALVMTDNRKISAADLHLEGYASVSGQTLEEAREGAESDAIRTAIARNGFHMGMTARELAVSRVTLYRLMQKHGIRAEHPLHPA
ncbi:MULTISPECIES: sigma-54 dependent transcriptional regulator [Ralstonia]|jgi:DNA-binding NtrC family response regulator|uniref:Anaerobic nitric oxide reductase transcription regulator NorR n=3 Tax=Ralstonia TaxID=48736 RepID=A0AAD2BTA3_9RALS|nr:MULTISPECIES: sigma-54 dependent transcriptional regulator [Ralstonia]MEA3270333.1 sigma-54 dependent transcriptional regulator [Pseudomonadota bacterium]ENZ79721.1 response regulator with CheY-like receiver, AAA-type ATPase, and DNA-binding domain [Ralstonia pickettii OR214]MBB0026773.1 sigma-54-dependent Fis family transcriptional regulator [Ralstonia pickettii]MBB0037481.1 sigma-54-dependent Fis family transcriptional regulator [Ralstonia pickettii]MBB0099936.1 sigma-54-dependent Fis fam